MLCYHLITTNTDNSVESPTRVPWGHFSDISEISWLLNQAASPSLLVSIRISVGWDSTQAWLMPLRFQHTQPSMERMIFRMCIYLAGKMRMRNYDRPHRNWLFIRCQYQFHWPRLRPHSVHAFPSIYSSQEQFVNSLASAWYGFVCVPVLVWEEQEMKNSGKKSKKPSSLVPLPGSGAFP